ncbi:protein of unknown function [Sinomicrobium oceani]|uniref:DUF4126 domain-containing protein n=1 Tax=Sinomicrobium oceani TaxID=1150368 RepID=A0A1K1QC57_9FLAO|nr:DUF4126 domain-containing protein [Sinomicrobium oceani]SFW57309.1 protein of unknown function [Sinomicrobium oceani]
MDTGTIVSIFLGVGLAASVGFRVFLPLLVLGMASHFGLWELNESWRWIGSIPALTIWGVAVIAEIFAYYIPWVDNLLDSIALPLAGIAGTLAVVSTAAGMDPAMTWTIALIAGGGTAAAIKGASSATRLTSSVTTAGFGNPILSTIETIISAVLSVLSVLLPVIAIILVIIILFMVLRFYNRIRPGRKAK